AALVAEPCLSPNVGAGVSPPRSGFNSIRLPLLQRSMNGSWVQVGASLRVRMAAVSGRGLEREPPVPLEEHPGPCVGVRALDEVGPIVLEGAWPVPDGHTRRDPKLTNEHRHRRGVLLTEAGLGLRQEREQRVRIVGGIDFG